MAYVERLNAGRYMGTFAYSTTNNQERSKNADMQSCIVNAHVYFVLAYHSIP